jgi:hypothetical protein
MIGQPPTAGLDSAVSEESTMRNRILATTLVVAAVGITSFEAQQPSSPPPSQTSFLATVSDSTCGASHLGKMKSGMNERACVFDCVKSMARFVLVDQNKKVIPILNQEAAGLPLYANKLVLVTGEIKGDAIMLAKVEEQPSHVHIGHVMTNWRDTPSQIGLLTAAIADAKTAATHAKLAAASADNLDQMKTHAGHVLNALDPSLQPKGPGSGYGVKKGTAGALQHVGFAAKANGASAAVKMHAEHVSASLTNAAQWTDQAIAVAQKIQASTTSGDAAALTTELVALTSQLSEGVDANKDGQVGWQTGEGGLQQAQVHMSLMMKAEGM